MLERTFRSQAKPLQLMLKMCANRVFTFFIQIVNLFGFVNTVVLLPLQCGTL